MCDYYYYYFSVSTHCYQLLVNAFLKLFFVNNACYIQIFKLCAIFLIFGPYLASIWNMVWGLILTVIHRFTDQSFIQPRKLFWSQSNQVVFVYVWKDTCQITASPWSLDAVWNIFPWCTATQTHNIKNTLWKIFMVIIWPFISCKTVWNRYFWLPFS